jgi:hypothetical protein
MRKSLLLILPLVLVALGYAAWPVWSAWQLRAAVKARDAAGIERRVDWTLLRSNLKRTIGANLRDESRSPDAAGLAGAVKRTLGPFVADRVIDVAVGPRTLARVLAGRLDPTAMARDAAAGATGGETDSAAPNDPLSPRRLRWAFFESPTRFRVEIADRAEPNRRVVSIFALQGAGWKLVDVYYRTLT